ncbi:MAG: glycine cleavage system protein H [Candidatus Hodarchaeales archaeon]
MGDKKLEISTQNNKYEFPLDRYYYKLDPGHIWFKPNNTVFEVGYDDFGQKQGPILNVRTRKLGKEYPQGKAFGTVETDKFIGPQRLPLTAILIEINPIVIENPQAINQDPYSNWVIKIKPTKFEEEINSPDIIPIGDFQQLKTYMLSELVKYEEEYRGGN